MDTLSTAPLVRRMNSSKMQDARRANLRRLVDEAGGPSTLAKKLGHEGPSYLSQLVTGKRPITEKTARKFEEQLGLSLGALDITPGDRLPFSGTDHTLVAASVRAVGAALESAGIQVKSAKFAELVSVVYEHSVPTGRVDPAYVQRLISLLS